MTLFDRRNKSERLASLLDRERAALLRGDFSALRNLATEKERLMSLIAREQPAGHWLEMIRRKVARNHTLLSAARQGILSVSRDLGAGATEFGTYDGEGQRNAAPQKVTMLERRV